MTIIEESLPSEEKQWNTFSETYINVINYQLRDMAVLSNNEYLFISNLKHYLDTQPNDGWLKAPKRVTRGYFFRALAMKVHSSGFSGIEKMISRLEDRGFVELENLKIRVTEKFHDIVEENGGLYKEAKYMERDYWAF